MADLGVLHAVRYGCAPSVVRGAECIAFVPALGGPPVVLLGADWSVVLRVVLSDPAFDAGGQFQVVKAAAEGGWRAAMKAGDAQNSE